MRKLLYIYIPTIFILINACKRNDIDTNGPSYDLILEGGINSFTHDQFIRLSKPASLNEISDQPLNGAQVSVNDVMFQEIAGTGIYTATMTDNRNYDITYKLTIVYQGKTYTANEKMVQVYPIDSSYIPLTVKAEGERFKVTIPKHIFGVFPAQRWLITKATDYWRPSIFGGQNQYSYSHAIGTPNALNPLRQQQRILYAEKNDSLKIYKFSLSDTYSTFLYNVFQETEWKGILSSNPANVKGNISGNANGYFYAMDVDTNIIAVKDLNK